jgi:glycosyltransferase involved in cell wall biosynthesis
LATNGRRVSIVIPTRGSSHTLVDCLQSIRKQSYGPLEIIVVGDLRGDEGARIAQRFGAVVVEHRGNRASARNRGVSCSKGDYLLFIDSDQTLEEDVVKECVELCEREEVEGVKIPELFVGQGLWSRSSAVWKNMVQKVEGASGGIPRFYRRSALQKHVLNEALTLWEDYDLYSRLKRDGARFAWASSHIYHKEPGLLEMLAKSFRYGTAISASTNAMGKTILVEKVQLTLRTLLCLLKSRTPAILKVGCIMTVLLKASASLLGALHRRFMQRRTEDRFQVPCLSGG